MASKGLVGIVCDEGLTRAICVEGSKVHRDMTANGGMESTKIAHIPYERLQSFVKNGMEIDYLRQYMIEK